MDGTVNLDGGAGSETFAEDTSAVLDRLRRALLALFANQPGGLTKSRDAQKLFGVNAKLSWQLFKLGSPGAPLSLAPHVPTASSMRNVFAAIRAEQVPLPLVNELRAAYTAFEELVESYAGDRTSFDSMVRSLQSGGDEWGDMQHRKAMFKACSHYWGMQVNTYLTVGIMHPSSTQGLFDYAHIRCKYGLRRLRSDASAIVDAFRVSAIRDNCVNAYGRDALDPAAAEQFGAPILPAFCTKPLPQFQTGTDADGTSYSELLNSTVGRAGAVDMTFGQVSRSIPLSAGSTGKGLGFGANVRITSPTTLMIADMLVHRPTLPRLSSYLRVYGTNIREGSVDSPLGAVRLPFSETVTLMQAGPRNAWTHETPGYVDMLNDVVGRVGWNLDEFDLYRVRIEYPLMHTRIAMGFDVM